MKSIKLLLGVVLGILVFTQCGSSYQRATAYDYQARSESARGELNAEDYERKILYSAEITLKINSSDSVNLELRELAKRYNGYLSEEGTTKSIVRIKSEGFKEALDDISLLGNVLNKNVLGLDVTEDYYDYQIRLENAEKSRERYLELLSKAENVEAALKVEKELERLNETIDLLKGKMQAIEHAAEFATIEVYLKERNKPGPLGYVGIGIYETVKWLFVRG